MLIFSAQSLAFIAVPKTGSTAIAMALKPTADIIFTKRRKHITAQRFHNRVAPFLDQEFGVRRVRLVLGGKPALLHGPAQNDHVPLPPVVPCGDAVEHVLREPVRQHEPRSCRGTPDQLTQRGTRCGPRGVVDLDLVIRTPSVPSR